MNHINKPYIECNLIFDKSRRFMDHFYQAITGFIILQKENIISLKFDFSSNFRIPFSNFFAAKINGKTVFYDLSDGALNFEINECLNFLKENNAILFKRAYESKLFDSYPSIRPYGLNYYGFYPFYLKILIRSLHRLDPRYIFSLLGSRFGSEQYWNIKNWTPEKTIKKNSNKILFCTRLWENQDEINDTRIRLIRRLKKDFKSDVISGVKDTPLARKSCKDLILPDQVANRKNFINLINCSSVCITSTGLDRSIGWRMGEFVSAGKAILSEPLHFSVPGDFQEGKNYLSFNSVDEAIEKCNYLLSLDDKRHTMEMENLHYYFHYLKPDVLIFNTLKQTLSQFQS